MLIRIAVKIMTLFSMTVAQDLPELSIRFEDRSVRLET